MRILNIFGALSACLALQGCFQNSRNSNNNVEVQTETVKVRETCEDCNGTGYVYYKCSYCDGSGTYQTYKAHTTKNPAHHVMVLVK